jgi:hypothetical protein
MDNKPYIRVDPYPKTHRPERKMQLEIIDPTGKVKVTHYIRFDANEENKLHLDIGGHKYILKHTGELIWAVPKDDNG